MLSLETRIVALLKRLNGEKLDTARIAAHLGLVIGNTGEAWQNVGRIAQAWAKLVEYEKVLTTPDSRYIWIEPPRDDVGQLIH